jgi:hypothetical protein
MHENRARFCGSLLAAGLVVFMIGAVFWQFTFQLPVLADTLRSVGAESARWLWIHAWLAGGVVITMAGLSVWVEIQRDAGEKSRTPAGVTLYLVGAILWLIAIGIRVTIQAWAADEVLEGRGVPAIYPAIHRLAGLLYAAHMLLSYVSTFLLGLGVVSSGVLSKRTGWLGVVGGSVFSLGFLLARGGPFAPPFMAHLYSCWLGSMLLWKTRRRSTEW